MPIRPPARLRHLLPLLAVLSPWPAAAATLGYDTLPAPVVSGLGESYGEPGFGLSLLGDGAAGSTAPALAAGLWVAVPSVDPLALLGAVFVTFGDGGEFLSGDLAAAGFVTGPGADVIELLFADLTGEAAAEFGALALLEIRGEFGDDPFGAGFGSFDDPLAVRFTLAPAVPSAVVPLAPALAFLPAAVGALALAAGRRRA